MEASFFGQWSCWYAKQSTDPLSGPVSEMANFLAELHEEGLQYNSTDGYWSAIISVHDKVEGANVGQHPTIIRLLIGIYHDGPPLPRYTSIWNVQKVLDYIETLGDSGSLPLKQLSWKTAFLLAIVWPSRSADLSQPDRTRKQHRPEGMAFIPGNLAKQSQQVRPIPEFFFPSFPGNPRLCSVQALEEYKGRTESLREGENKLFIAVIRPNKAVTSSSIAKWLKALLEEAGVDTSIFGADSGRRASASTASRIGITTNNILSAADWSSRVCLPKLLLPGIGGCHLRENSDLYQHPE